VQIKNTRNCGGDLVEPRIRNSRMRMRFGAAGDEFPMKN